MSAYIFPGSVSGVHISSDDIIKTSKQGGKVTHLTVITQEIVYFLQIRFILELWLHLGVHIDMSRVSLLSIICIGTITVFPG